MSNPREGEIWSVRHLLAEGVIRDALVVAVVEGQESVFRRTTHVPDDDVVFTFVGSDQQHTCALPLFRRNYVRRVAFAGELRRIGRELRRLAGGDVHLNELAGEIDAQADLLTVGL